MARINLGKVVPEKGIDYFTDAEVEEIKNEIKTEIDAQGMARDIELLKTDSGHTIEMTLNENYQIVLVLKNAAGTALSTQTIDLPNENAVTNLAYNNGVLTITKQSGATSQVDISSLIEGLVTESDFNTFKEALQAILEAINEKDAEQDEAIAENYKVINKLNEKLENQQKVINQLPQVEGQGTEVTLEDTIEAPFTKFDVEGNSTQETTEGKNLLPVRKNLVKTTINGITFTPVYNENGLLEYINVNGTATAIAAYDLFNSSTSVEDVKNYSAGSYLLNTNKTSGNVRLFCDLKKEDNTFIYPDSQNAEKSVALTGTTQLTREYLLVSNGVTCDNEKIKPQLLLSTTTNKEYEPYTNGASPNPSYEQPIESAGDNENLFDGETELGSFDNSGQKVASTAVRRNVNPILVKPNSTYILGRNGTELANRVYYYTSNNTFISAETTTGLFTTPNNCNYINFISDRILTDFAKIKLEKGNKASGYSPYGMGSINEKIQTRNWFDVSKISQLIKNGTTTSNGITNIDNVITINKTNGQHGSYAMNYLMPIKSGQITVSFKALLSGTHSNTGILVALYNSTATIYATTAQTKYASSKDKWLDYSATFELNQEAIDGIHLDIQAANTGNVIQIKDVQVELGSTASPFIEHEEQDYSIFVQQPMRSIGDVRDCFVKKSDNKKYERHYIGEVVLNGTEYWELLNSTSDYYEFITYNSLKPVAPSSYTFPMASHFGNATNNRCVANGNQLLIRVPASMNITNATEFKNWLQENNVTINYLLAEPLDLPCTEEQIQQIENKPSTYKDFTIIQSEDETPAYLEVAGIYDLNKLITRTEVLESEV